MYEIIVSSIKYIFPESVKKGNNIAWKLLDVIDLIYNEDNRPRSLQSLWEVLHLMDYYTPKGIQSRSLILIKSKQILDLVSIVIDGREWLEYVSASDLSMCEQDTTLQKIRLDPQGFVCFPKELGFAVKITEL